MKIKLKKAGGGYRAFTLIELLVVVAILGILAGVVIMNLGGLTDRARMAAGQRFSHSIRTRLALDEVGNWALDRADGTITHDFSGWDNHGTINLGTGGNTNLAAAFVPGVHGQAMSFDGVDDRIDLGNPVSLQIFTRVTLIAWVSPAIIATRKSIYHAGMVDAQYWGVSIQNGRVLIQNDSAIGGNLVGSVILPLNQ